MLGVTNTVHNPGVLSGDEGQHEQGATSSHHLHPREVQGLSSAPAANSGSLGWYFRELWSLVRTPKG